MSARAETLYEERQRIIESIETAEATINSAEDSLEYEQRAAEIDVLESELFGIEEAILSLGLEVPDL